MVRYRGLVIADDLTGAADTGHEFAARGHRTVVRLHETALPDASVLVANTDSRECSPADAQARITTVCNDVTADITYKKIDSTLRGNVTAEVAAALSATGAALAVVAPAFPATNRTTVDGYHRLDDQPVTETIEDVPSAHLPSLFSGSFPVAHVGIDTVRRGSAVVQERFASALETYSKPVIIVCDAVHSSHLDAIATGAAALDQSVLYVGSAGLARHVSIPGRNGAIERRNEASARRTDGERRILGIVGSTNERTREQLDALPQKYVVPLDATAAITDDETTAKETADACTELFRDVNCAVVASVSPQNDAKEIIRYGRTHGLSDEEIQNRIAAALATTARTVCERWSIHGFVLTGGAVATAVLSALDADGLSLLGAEVGSGVPIGEIVGGLADGTPVITKAGGFGERGILQNAVDCLNDDEC